MHAENIYTNDLNCVIIISMWIRIWSYWWSKAISKYGNTKYPKSRANKPKKRLKSGEKSIQWFEQIILRLKIENKAWSNESPVIIKPLCF